MVNSSEILVKSLLMFISFFAETSQKYLAFILIEYDRPSSVVTCRSLSRSLLFPTTNILNWFDVFCLISKRKLSIESNDL